jgi:glycosyltransferase involved in cell wall biosynthesis
MKELKISAVINTLNEERNLEMALKSIYKWVDEIIVVDMYSEDKTVDVARRYGAQVYFHQRLDFADPARAFALSKAKNNWILMLDADEVVPFQLVKKLLQIVKLDLADVVFIPWCNYLLGVLMKASGWGILQDFHPRFFKVDFMTSTGEIHNFLHFSKDARILRLEAIEELAVHHFNYINYTHFISKLNRYTTIEAAQKMLLEKNQSSPSKALLLALKEFLVRFFWKQGYLDGWRGFYLSLAMAFYKLSVQVKLTELVVIGDEVEIVRKYNEIAETLIQGPLS